MADNPDLRQLFDPTGQIDLTDVFFQLTFLILALAVAGYAVAAVSQIRAEEVAGHAEPLLAGAVGRTRWLVCRLAVPFVSSALLLGLGGLGAGISDAWRSGDPGQLLRVAGAAWVWIPAVWLLAAVAVLLTGLAPRAVPLAWALLAGCAVLALLGNVLQPPGWVLDLSPFTHVPALPGEELSVVPLVVMAATAGVVTAGGVAAFRRRDIG